jgi:hypothetical protein
MLTEIAFRRPGCVLERPSRTIFDPPSGSDDPAVCLERAAGLRIYINTC